MYEAAFLEAAATPAAAPAVTGVQQGCSLAFPLVRLLPAACPLAVLFWLAADIYSCIHYD